MSKVFIPFLDGILDYDCQDCGAGCCKGGLIVATEAERRLLLREYPSLGMFLLRESNNLFTFQKYPPCWFLDGGGSCRIQEKYGYVSKPFICRLHPFYVSGCGDEYVIIPDHCGQLSITKRGKQGHLLHEAIFANAQEAIKAGFVHDDIDLSRERLDLEKRLLAASAQFLDRTTYLDFAAFQMAAASGGSDSVCRATLSEMLDLWKRFFGRDEAVADNSEVTRELTLATTLLRTSAECLRRMEAYTAAMALLALYFCMLVFSGGGPQRTYVDTYRLMLSDIPLGLIHLNADDLRIASEPLEKKIQWVRALRKLNSPLIGKT